MMSVREPSQENAIGRAGRIAHRLRPIRCWERKIEIESWDNGQECNLKLHLVTNMAYHRLN